MSESADPNLSAREALDRAMLDRAARAALRAAGDVEPNPLVGCVIADSSGRLVGIGHHRRFGGPHAEIEALADAARRGRDVRGATAWVTLEPCRGVGKTGPCADALLRAGVREVVFAAHDPAPKGRGGADALRDGGVLARLSLASPLATSTSAAHRKRSERSGPWVIAKWAQTPSGSFVADHGRWISGPASLRRVHRLRARVDAVVVGVGTVLADDPLLTARGAARVRRLARRVVLDSTLRTPLHSALVRTAHEAPLTIVTLAGAPSDRAAALRAAGAELLTTPPDAQGRVDAAGALALLAEGHGAAVILLECGPTLLSECLRRGLLDEAWAFVGGAADAPADLRSVADEHGYERALRRRSGADALLIYRPPAPTPSGVSSAGHSPR